MGRRFLSLTVAMWLLSSGKASCAQPERIISLGPALTESLFLLGMGDRIVGVTVYCTRPPEARSKEKVGTVVDVNVEKILSLKPDMVLATSLTNIRDVKELKKLGINVVTFPNPRDFFQLCQQFVRLGMLVGREEEAQEIVERVRAGVDSVVEALKGLPKPKVFVQVGAKPLFTITRDSFINDLIEFAGGVNIAQDAETGLYSREKVLEADPDVIIIATMGIVGEDERRTWHKYRPLKAVKYGRIYVMDSYDLCSPTPITFLETLRKLAKLLHPEIDRAHANPR